MYKQSVAPSVNNEFRNSIASDGGYLLYTAKVIHMKTIPI